MSVAKWAITPPTHVQITGTNTRGGLFAVELHEDGKFVVRSDFGHWHHWWNARGSQSLAAFCLDIDQSYADGKLCNKQQLDDFDATTKAVKKRIIELRRQGDLDEDEAREEWNALTGAEDSNHWSRLSALDEPWHLCHTKQNPTFRNFWETTWLPCIVPALREVVAREEYLQSEQAAADLDCAIPLAELPGLWYRPGTGGGSLAARACDCGVNCSKIVVRHYTNQWHIWHTNKDIEVRVDSAIFPQPQAEKQDLLGAIQWADEVVGKISADDSSTLNKVYFNLALTENCS